MKIRQISVILLLIYPVLLLAQDYQALNIPVIHFQEKLAFPFVGGFNCPQFNQLDIDQDGDQDLLVFDRSNAKLAVFIWEDESWVYDVKYNNYFPELTQWVLLRDYNQDGYMDIFTAPLNSTSASIRVFKGGWRDGHISFKALSFPYGQGDVISFQFLNLYYGVYVARTDVPAIVDVDKDGDLDVLSFESGGGTVNYYQNKSLESGLSVDSFKMELVDRCWGKFRESILDESIILSDDPDECAESFGLRHAGSTMTLEDLDGDGDLDIILGDADYPSLIKIENGDQDRAFGVSVERDYPKSDIPVDLNWFNSCVFLDIDQDGQKEMLVSPNVELGSDNVQNLWLYKDADPTQKFVPQFQSDEFLLQEMIDWGAEVFPSWIDIDQDGLVDLIVGVAAMRYGGTMESKLLYYKNTGKPHNPELSLWDEDYLDLSNTDYEFLAPAFGDLNGDQVPDLLVGEASGKLIYFENLAKAGEAFHFADMQEGYMGIDVGYKALPAIFDVNDDGLNDLVIGNELSYSNEGKIGSLALFSNIGTSSDPHFEAHMDHASNVIPWADIAVHGNNFDRTSLLRPYFITVNEQDYLLYGSIRGKVALYIMDVSGRPVLVNDHLGDLEFGNYSAPAMADINNNGQFELIVGMGSGGFQLYETDIVSADEVSLQKKQTGFSFDLSPNPAHDWIEIRRYDGLTQNERVLWQIFDVYGKKRFSTTSQANLWRLSIKNLAAGHYYLRLTGEQQFCIKEFIVL